MVLIDTHLVLWAALAPERLPPRAMKLLVAQAMHEGITLLSADKMLKRYGKSVQSA